MIRDIMQALVFMQVYTNTNYFPLSYYAMSFLVQKQLIKHLRSPAINNRKLLQPHFQHRVFTTAQQPPVSKTKQFMKKYGYVGIGVYLVLSAADLAATMAVISVKGADKVRQAEDYALEKAKGWLGMKHTPLNETHLHEKPSFASVFLIAYGIHKTILLPFRLSLTAAVTPAVARRLMNWGWLKNKLNR
jgi:hypothetical protein